MVLRFRVDGLPASQGSLRAFVVKGRPVVTHDSSRTRPWREAVKYAALQARGDRAPSSDRPLVLQLQFRLPKPAGYATRTPRQRARWLWPWRKPDLDKLVRAVLDALTGILFSDDAQIVRIEAEKAYGDRPGLDVALWAASDVADHT